MTDQNGGMGRTEHIRRLSPFRFETPVVAPRFGGGVSALRARYEGGWRDPMDEGQDGTERKVA